MPGSPSTQGEGEVYIFVSDLRRKVTEYAVEVYQKDVSYRKDPYADFSCTTVWYQDIYNEWKGKTLKIKEIDHDVLLCLNKYGQIEKIDDETIRVK